MVDAYDPGLRAAALAVAKRSGVALHEGVYMWILGPQFETPGRDPHVPAARRRRGGHEHRARKPSSRGRAGMKVLALSLITNMAAGLSEENLSHAHTLEQAGRVKSDGEPSPGRRDRGDRRHDRRSRTSSSCRRALSPPPDPSSAIRACRSTSTSCAPCA